MTASDEERAIELNRDISQALSSLYNIKCRLNRGCPEPPHAFAIARIMDAAIKLIEGIDERDVEQILEEQTEIRNANARRLNQLQTSK